MKNVRKFSIEMYELGFRSPGSKLMCNVVYTECKSFTKDVKNKNKLTLLNNRLTTDERLHQPIPTYTQSFCVCMQYENMSHITK